MYRGAAWYGLALACAIIGACGFSGSGGASEIDGDPGDDPDAPPGTPDARRIDARPGEPDARPPDARVDARPTATCTPGYAPVTNGSPAEATYKGVSTRRSWDAARTTCQDEGAELVVLDNAAEAAAVADLVQDPGQSPFFWMGVYDPPSGADNDWVTVRGGSPPYLDWEENQPSGSSQNCVLVGDFGENEFYDFDCGATQVYVCECLP